MYCLISNAEGLNRTAPWF